MAGDPQRTIWSRFRKNPQAVAGGVLVALIFFVAATADLLANNKPFYMSYQGKNYFPLFVRYTEFRELSDFKELVPSFKAGDWALFPVIPFAPDETDAVHRLVPPSGRHLLGTTEVGQDVLTRLIHGSRVSLLVGLIAVGLSVLIGVFLGGIAGYAGGKVDAAIMRLTEVVICFPTLYLILAVLAVLKPSLVNVMVVLGLTRWTPVCRLLRGEVLKLREREFVLAARVLGGSNARVLIRHILPNAMAPVLVAATFGVASAILLESALSFLGFGVQPPTPSWGEMLDQGRRYVTFAYWLILAPGLMVFLTVTSYNLLGEGLRDAVDPQQIR